MDVCSVFSLGGMLPLFSHPLYCQVAQLTERPPAVPHVPAGVEIQRILAIR